MGVPVRISVRQGGVGALIHLVGSLVEVPCAARDGYWEAFIEPGATFQVSIELVWGGRKVLDDANLIRATWDGDLAAVYPDSPRYCARAGVCYYAITGDGSWAGFLPHGCVFSSSLAITEVVPRARAPGRPPCHIRPRGWWLLVTSHGCGAPWRSAG